MNDILINGDITIKDGDLLVGDSDAQNIVFILEAKPGQFYQFPTLGVGTVDLINSPINRQALKITIKNNLEADNYRINRIEVAGTIDQLLTNIDADKLR